MVYGYSFFFQIVWKIIEASFDERRVRTSLLAHRGLLHMIHTEVTSIKYICDLFAFLCIMRMHRFLAICLNEKRSRTGNICILIFIATLFSLLFLFTLIFHNIFKCASSLVLRCKTIYILIIIIRNFKCSTLNILQRERESLKRSNIDPLINHILYYIYHIPLSYH